MKGTSEEYIQICLPLYEASVTCDWQAAKTILHERPELVRFGITKRYETALHIAAAAKPTKVAEEFLENLVKMMNKEDLELENLGGENALHIAVESGSIKMVETLLNKHKALLSIVPRESANIPLAMSAYCGNHEMTRYLYGVSENMNIKYHFTRVNRLFSLFQCVHADMFEIWRDCHDLIITRHHTGFILDALVGKVDELNSTKPTIVWEIIDSIFAKLHMKKRRTEKDNSALNLLKMVVKSTMKFSDQAIIAMLEGRFEGDEIQNLIHRNGLLFSAAETGNTRFVIELIRAYPDVLWMTNNDGHTIFHIAIMHRHHGIYNLLNELGSRKLTITTMLDNNDNSVLHLVGMTSKKIQIETDSGASLLMQRDLLWLQDVEKMMPAHLRGKKNNDGKTAYKLFFDNNKDLISGGLKWVKDSMVVATLIVTVAFAVAFTIPGGYHQDSGFPVFIHEPSFLVFVIADAISLFSSSTSLLVFLSILTSHYSQRDFLYSLPRKLMIGLVSLFISVAAMMITFAASFFVLYRHGMKWIPIVITIFAATPVVVFATLQSPLWLDMFRSMYDSRYIFNPRKPVLYVKKPRL